ncbi:SCO2521 family protein [Nocardia sp. CA-135398]|uniref:SCO2521 family protein n=1 Tax=Nocardia sp. CA-135398 TaxID=3239977 RepID=UPI003D97B986
MNEPNDSAARRMRAARSTPHLRQLRRGRAVRLLVRAGAAQTRTPVGPLVVFGEVDTCLLPAATPLSRGDLEELLELVPGRPMLWRERPMSLAVSPTTAEGVDCRLAAPSHPDVRAIGTVATHAVVVGGRVLQSSARTRVVRAAGDQRRTWSHYLSQVGVSEVITKVTAETGVRLAEGFLAAGPPPMGTLDLASIANRLLGRIRMDQRLDQNTPVQSGTTRLRWAARIGDPAQPVVWFRLRDDTVRTVLITVRTEAELADVQRFCEDLAVHDWLLSVTAAALEQSDLFAPGSAESVAVLAPVLHHLAHLWVPGAHTPPALRGLWTQLNTDPDFTAGRRALIDQLHNRVLVATLDAVRHTRIGTEDYSAD